jgi:hypothetical protein
MHLKGRFVFFCQKNSPGLAVKNILLMPFRPLHPTGEVQAVMTSEQKLGSKLSV